MNNILLGFNDYDLLFTILWLVVVIAAVIIESQTAEMVSIWFAVGALCACISSIFKAHILIQIGIFVLISVIFIFATRPFIKKMMRVAPIKMNKERYIDTICEVVEEIEIGRKGKVVLEHQVWTAKSYKNKIMNIGEKVIIIAIEGNTLIVDKIDNIEII